MQTGNRRIYLIKIAIVGGITILLILGIGALRVTTPNPDTDSAFASVISRLISKPPSDRPNPASKKRDYLKNRIGPKACESTVIGGKSGMQRFMSLKWGVELKIFALGLNLPTPVSWAGRRSAAWQDDLPNKIFRC